MPLPWRGTLLYSGALAAVAVAVTARFAGAEASTITADGGAGARTSSVTASSATAAPASSPTAATPARASTAPTPSATVAAPPAVTPTAAAQQPPGPASGSTGASDSTTTSSQVITGGVVSTRYGNVQVAVTFTDGVISSVATLQAPSGHESSRINAYATPILAQEAVAANSANIDTVSGATFTSQAYAKSLQSAIDQLG